MTIICNVNEYYYLPPLYRCEWEVVGKKRFVCAENNQDPARYEKLLKEGVSFTRP